MRQKMPFHLLFLSVLGLSSCAAARQDVLKDSIDTYVKALRRGQPEVAMSYVVPEKRAEFAKNSEGIDQELFISHVELKSVSPDEKLESAVVTLLMEFYNQGSASVQIARRQFLWKFDQKAKGWLVDTASPLGN